MANLQEKNNIMKGEFHEGGIMFNDYISLTYTDLQNIIMMANREGHNGRYIFKLSIIQPKTASQDSNSSLAWDSHILKSASFSEPVPSVTVW